MKANQKGLAPPRGSQQGRDAPDAEDVQPPPETPPGDARPRHFEPDKLRKQHGRLRTILKAVDGAWCASQRWAAATYPGPRSSHVSDRAAERQGPGATAPGPGAPDP